MDEPRAAERIEREHLLPYPVEEVWSAITDPSGLAEWLGERVVADPRPGGELEVGGAGGDDARTGFFEVVDEVERRIAFWWRRPDQDATRVEIELREESPGTVLRVVETRPLRLLDAGGSLIETWATEASGPQMRASVAIGA